MEQSREQEKGKMDGDTEPGAKSRETGIEQTKALMNSLPAPTSWLPSSPAFLTGDSSSVSTSHTLSKGCLVGCVSGPRTLPTRLSSIPPDEEGTVF